MTFFSCKKFSNDSLIPLIPYKYQMSNLKTLSTLLNNTNLHHFINNQQEYNGSDVPTNKELIKRLIHSLVPVLSITSSTSNRKINLLHIYVIFILSTVSNACRRFDNNNNWNSITNTRNLSNNNTNNSNDNNYNYYTNNNKNDNHHTNICDMMDSKLIFQVRIIFLISISYK